MTTQSNRADYNHKEYIADSDSDINNLPTDCAPGSTCLIVGDGTGAKVYMLNNEKEWTLI